MTQNLDQHTVDGFGEEWAAFDQSALPPEEHERWFQAYFGIFPWAALPLAAEGFDLGCGSGRWAMKVAPKVGTLHCIDPAAKALDVARRRLGSLTNVRFHQAGAGNLPLAEGTQDFGYSLGVLHHVPDTRAALAEAVRLLKPGAPFLLYLYYALDDRPAWFRALWRTSEAGRNLISRLPFPLRRAASEAIAAGVYWPLARGARTAEKLGLSVTSWPLNAYRNGSYYTMRTDALDRFGTRLEQRFTRGEIETMMRSAGLENIAFSDKQPFWVACGTRAVR
nr:methyltransferase domain-containing protein [uncultured Sphingomonas sp.]